MRIVNPVGKKGEDLATEYLMKNGYKILERNYRKQYTEIDIIAQKDNVLVFIEVKTRTSNIFGTPLEAISPRKVQLLLKLATYYSMQHAKLPQALRIDAIALTLGKNLTIQQIEHVKNISY